MDSCAPRLAYEHRHESCAPTACQVLARAKPSRSPPPLGGLLETPHSPVRVGQGTRLRQDSEYRFPIARCLMLRYTELAFVAVRCSGHRT